MSTSSNSGNSTSLYGEAGTPIPDSSGNVIVRGDLWVLSGNILTTATTGNIFPANATTINLGLAATAVNIGAATGTTTINNALTAGGTVTAPGADFGNITIGVATDNTITTTSGDLDITAVGTSGVNIVSGNDAPTLITRTTNNTNNSTRSLALAVQSSGTPTVGFGNILDFQVETAPGNTEQAGFINIFSTDLTAASEDFSMSFGLMQNGSAYTTKMFLDSTGSLTLDNDLTVGGVNINMAPSTNFLYSENNNRTNRPEFQSTSGNSSGLRVRAPNTTTSASSTFSVNNSSDSANTEFLALQARGTALGDTFRIFTGEYIVNVLSASNKSISFTDYLNTYATVNPAGPTVGTDLTTKTYVDNAVATTGVTSITGTANQVIASSSTGAVTLSLPQSIATTSNVTFADVIVGDDLTVQGNNVNLAQATIIGYDENNLRANRPQVQSTSGNGSGFRILAPNATTSATSNLTVFGSNDISNGEFLSLQATGSTTAPFSIRTGRYTAGVLGASSEEINIADGGTTYASINPAGPTVSTDLTTKAYVDALAPGGVTSVTGGTHVTASPTTGAVVVTTDATDANTASTIVARDASGNFSAGQGTFTTVATPTIISGASALTITGGAVDPSILTLNSNQTTLALDGGAGYGDSTLTTAFNALTWNHTAGVLDTGSVNGTWQLGLDGKTYFPNYNLPYVSGAVNTVLTNDGSGNVTWALPGGGGSTFGNITVGVDTDNTIGTTSGDLILDSASGILQLADANLSSTVAQTWTLLDNNASALSIGATGKADILKIVSTDSAEGVTMSGTLGVTGNTTLTGSLSGDNANINRLIRTNNGTGSNVVVELSRNRADAARATDGGSQLGFGYVGTDNTQGTAAQNAIRSMYEAAGNHKIQFLQLPGSYNTPTVMGQIQRGSTFFNTTGGVANLFLSDTIARVGGTTTTITNSANTQTYASLGASSGNINQDTFSIRNNAGTTTYGAFTSTGTTITGAGLSQITRTTVGTPTVVESRPSFNIQLTRSDQAAPESGDGTGFRSRVAGSNGTNYTMSDLSSSYSNTGDYAWFLNLANGDQTGATFTSVNTINSKVSATTIRAGTPSATPGASTVSDILTIDAAKITAAVPIQFPSYTVAAAGALTGALGQQIAISNSSTSPSQSDDGMMVYWATNGTPQWRYIHNNGAL